MQNIRRVFLSCVLPLILTPAALQWLPLHAARASGLGDGPSIAQDPAANLGDAYLFLDPNDNARAIIAVTVRGYLTPGAALSTVVFDPKVKFTFEIENTGDAALDKKLKVNFAAPVSPGAPQTAHIKGPGVNFTAATTAPTLAGTANAQIITDDPASGFRFFAGPADDPAFFDQAGVGLYLASLRSGAPNPAFLSHAKDSFAGYNTLAVAVSIPVNYLRGPAPTIALDVTAKRQTQTPSKTGGSVGSETFLVVDRLGNPAINALFVPFARQDEYNASKPADDAAGKFEDDLVATMKSYGAKDLFVSILKSIAISKGDLLRLDLSISNRGASGGSNPEAGFPNGRRPGDDTIDTLLTLIANGSPLGDGINASDVRPQDSFPFFALPHQP